MNGVTNAVIIDTIPMRGNKNVLTAPISMPTLTIKIENSPRGESASEDRTIFFLPCLNKRPPNTVPPDFIMIDTAIRTAAIKT